MTVWTFLTSIIEQKKNHFNHFKQHSGVFFSCINLITTPARKKEKKKDKTRLTLSTDWVLWAMNGSRVMYFILSPSLFFFQFNQFLKTIIAIDAAISFYNIAENYSVSSRTLLSFHTIAKLVAFCITNEEFWKFGHFNIPYNCYN